MADPFVGEIRVFGFNYAPQDWAFCNGQQVPISQNPALYSILGRNFGGDGKSYFQLPDIRGRVVMGPVNAAVGVTEGSNGVALTSGQIPQHNHTLNGDVGHSQSTSPEAQYPARLTDAGDNAFIPAASAGTLTTLSPASVSVYGSATPQAHENRQPFLTMNFCIALQGVYPVRPN